MKQTKVIIDRALCDSVQAAQLELQNIKDLLGFAYSSTEYNIPEERIAKLEKEFSELNAKYTLLKQQVESVAVPVEKNKLTTSWSLDFDTSTVTITEND